MSRIDFQLDCIHCGADLHGLSVSETCAQCGLPVGDTINLSALDPVDMSVLVDLPCIACDYNLRTRRFDSVCPECFKPVIESLRPDELRFADREWLRRLRGGVTLLLVVVVGISAVSLGYTLLGFLVSRASGPAWGFGVGSAALLFILCVLGVWAVFAVTTSEPHPRGRAGSNAPRNTARVLILCPIACMLVLFFLILFFTGSMGTGVGVFAGSLSLVLCIPGSLICTLSCLKRIAVGARRRGLEQLTAVLIWMIIAGAVAGGSGVVAQAIMLRQIMAQMVTAPPGPVQSPVLGPTTTAAVSPGGANDEPADAGESAGAVTAAAPSTTGTTTVTVVPGYAVTTTTTPIVPPGAAGPVPMPTPLWRMFFSILACGVSILLMGCSIVGLIVLIKYRNMLKPPIVASPVAQRLPAD